MKKVFRPVNLLCAVLQLFFALDLFAGNKIVGDAAKGEAIFTKTCVTCHGPDAMGLKDKEAPMLRHQHDWYLYKQLKDFQAKKRDNPKMYPFIKDLGDQDLKDLSAYISKLQ